MAATPDHVRALEAALVSARAAEERFRGLVESIDAVPYISAWDEPGTIRYMSPHVEELLGYPREQWYHGPDPWAANLHPDDRERVLTQSGRTFTEGIDFACEYRMHTADGRVVWIAERETIVRDEAGRPLFCHGVMFDITRLKTAEQRLVTAEAALREERDLAQRYLDVARTMLLVIDADESVRLLNQHGHELLGYPAGALIGSNWFDVAVPAGSARSIRAGFRGARWRARRRAAEAAAGRCSSPPPARCARWPGATRCCTRPTASPSGTLSSGEDITDQLRAEAEIRRLAFHDHLTGLPNRSHFDAGLRAAVDAAPRRRARGRAAVRRPRRLQARQRLARPRGRRRAAARRRRAARRARGRGAARPPRRRRVPRAARRAPARPAAAAAAARGAPPRRSPAGSPRRSRSPAREVRIQASVGCSLFPFDAADAEALLQHADAAMYRAKRRSSPQAAGR